MPEDLTIIPPIPNKLQKYFQCNLLHSKIPKLTGKRNWNEVTQIWEYEIIYVCEEGCTK